MTPKPEKYRARTLLNALHMEKCVSLELSKALQVQMVINEMQRARIDELEKK